MSGELVQTVEILDEGKTGVAQTIGPFRDANEAEDWILDQFGEFPTDEAHVSCKPLPDDAIHPDT